MAQLQSPLAEASRDGKRIAYWGISNGVDEARVYDRDQAADVLAGPIVPQTHPRISADGNRVAWSRPIPGTNRSEVALFDFTLGGEIPLPRVNLPGLSHEVQGMSANGELLVLAVQGAGGPITLRDQIAVVEVVTRDFASLPGLGPTDDPEDLHLDRDGRFLVGRWSRPVTVVQLQIYDLYAQSYVTVGGGLNSTTTYPMQVWSP